MAKDVPTANMRARPSTAQTTKSFTRYEPSKPSSIGRSRASTIQPGPLPSKIEVPTALPVSPDRRSQPRTEDIFEKRDSMDGASSPELDKSLSRSQSLPERFDELPIELISLTDIFVESLAAKVYSEPPSIEVLSELFQEFYIKASSNISTHISTLSSRLNRETSPNPSQSSAKAKALRKKSSGDSLEVPDKSRSAQQMLTASEVTERRKARKLLEYKRVALEEAIERRACEKVYNKIWRHKSTLDEVRDEKLRSKTAALALVGIGLKDLGIEIENGDKKTEDEVRESLSPAREGLAKMNNEKFPRGKLQNLTSAHKSIVDTLSTIHPSSSSADEILPTLIYTLITSPVEGINIISNLEFVQRFRAITKIDGEAAYCMTNLEAAISFLENVDLTSLRADEAPEGPPKSVSRPATPTLEKSDPLLFPPALPSDPGQPTVATTPSTVSASTLRAPSSSSRSDTSSPLPSPMHQRRLSNLLHPPAKAIGAANDAVRNTAEEGFKNISNTLDNSFKFLFGRLKERSTDDSQGEVILPKTLDEARQLVSRPATPEDDSMISETSSLAEKENESHLPQSRIDDKLLGLIGGRKAAPLRDRSVDSVQSNESGRRVAIAASGLLTNAGIPSPNAPPTQPNALESVKNLGNTLNPLSHIGSAFGGGFRSFSKAISTLPVALEKEKVRTPDPQLVVPKTFLDGTIKIEPPIQRFLDMKDSGDMSIKEVSELLYDYQRLAHALRGLQNS